MLFIAGLVCALVSMAMFQIACRYPDHLQRAIHRWGFSCLAAAVGVFLIYGRPVLPGFVSVVIGNWLIMLAFALAYFAVCRMSGCRCMNHMLVAAWLAISLLAYAAIHLGGASLSARVMTVALMKLPILALLILVPFDTRMQPTLHGLKSLGFIYFLYAVVSIMRALYALDTEWANALAMFRDPIQQLAVMTFVMALVVSSFLFTLALGAALNVELYRRATTDRLTGIFNRHAFEELARREVARGKRSGRAPGMLMVDVDHFKRINDSLGHLVGDEVLASVAKALAASLRQQDLIGRWGGEEFCVLLPETNASEVGAVAERLRTNVAELVGMKHADGVIPVTVSIGAVSPGQVINDFGALLQAADDALYRAKAEGRNRTVAA